MMLLWDFFSPWFFIIVLVVVSFLLWASIFMFMLALRALVKARHSPSYRLLSRSPRGATAGGGTASDNPWQTEVTEAQAAAWQAQAEGRDTCSLCDSVEPQRCCAGHCLTCEGRCGSGHCLACHGCEEGHCTACCGACPRCGCCRECGACRCRRPWVGRGLW